jgi:hypothetical protein
VSRPSRFFLVVPSRGPARERGIPGKHGPRLPARRFDRVVCSLQRRRRLLLELPHHFQFRPPAAARTVCGQDRRRSGLAKQSRRNSRVSSRWFPYSRLVSFCGWLRGCFARGSGALMFTWFFCYGAAAAYKRDERVRRRRRADVLEEICAPVASRFATQQGCSANGMRRGRCWLTADA